MASPLRRDARHPVAKTYRALNALGNREARDKKDRRQPPTMRRKRTRSVSHRAQWFAPANLVSDGAHTGRAVIAVIL
jgi:hypothetical protein